MRKIFFLFILFFRSLSGQIESGLPADCTRDRTVQLNGKTVYLAKGELCEKLRFVKWEMGLMNGWEYWRNEQGDTLAFWVHSGIYVKDTLTEICYALKPESYKEGDIVSPYTVKAHIPDSLIHYRLLPGQSWFMVYVHSLDYDTVVAGRCNGTGLVIADRWTDRDDKLPSGRVHHDSFQSYKKSSSLLNPLYCRCPSDPAMNGTFEDKESGEALQILSGPLQVYYRNNPKSQWRKLAVQQQFAGWLEVSFTPDFSRENYSFRFTGDSWMIPGDTYPSLKKAQFFKPVRP
ncbi:MAG: hypothetical protein JNL57_06870 [Bacteroidetes bacterium]|nr:hypothetical protein [Bacteroidota bacterium]